MMLDFTGAKLAKVQKGIKFLDKMVKMVFYSTFLFTIIAVTIAYIKDWESVMNTISERWFTVMVGELLVTGLIQIAKDIIQALIRRWELKEANNG